MSLRLRLFVTYAAVALVSLAVVALGVMLLLRGYAERLSLERLDNMTRPIQVQVLALIRGNVTPQELYNSLQEQADNNDAYLILVDGSGDILRQMVPQGPPAAQPIAVAPGALPHSLASPARGRFTSSDGRVFLFSAYPLVRPSGQLSRVETLVLATPRPGTLSVLRALVWPFLLAGAIALAVSLLIAILLARSVYHPLAGVTQAAQRIAGGDYSQRVMEEGPAEVRELARAFNHMSQEVEQTQLRLRHFVADVSHELRSPLTSIQGFAQAILDGTAADDATRLKAVQVIDEEARRLRRQVDELLELSRMQSGQASIAHEPVDLGELLGHCREVFDIQAREKKVALELTAEPGLVVAGDADRLEQVFNNLLDNAIKNSPPGGRVSISSRRVEGDQAQTTVADSGPGIAPDQLPRVFERFYQVTGVRTGVGLGLAIARAIVLAHGGSIEARSEPGEGARFTVSLPLWTPDGKSAQLEKKLALRSFWSGLSAARMKATS